MTLPSFFNRVPVGAYPASKQDNVCEAANSSGAAWNRKRAAERNFCVNNQQPIRVTVWGENLHEQKHDAVKKIYPNGMHTVIAEGIRERLGEGAQVRTATLDQPEHGLTDAVLGETDVLTWWGHMGHHLVEDAVVKKVHDRVLAGMGLVVLHSGHWSKLFVKLMGTSCTLRYREAGDKEVVWTISPSHPITRGLPPAFVIPEQEMYGERAVRHPPTG